MSDMTSHPPEFEVARDANSSVPSVSVPNPSVAHGGAAREIAGDGPADRAARARAATPVRVSRVGLAQAVRHLRLVVLVWFVFLALAWVAALPAWRWFSGVLSLAPEGDRLLAGLNIALLRELTHYDRSPTMAVAMGSSFTFFLFALVLNPFVAGGVLGVLRAPSLFTPGASSSVPSPSDGGERVRVRGITQRFVSEGMRSYWSFARILLLVGMLGGGVTLLLATAFENVGVAFDESGWPRASMWSENVMLLMWLTIFGVCSLIVDIARILLLHRDDRRAAAAVKQALAFLRKHVGALLVIGGIFVVMLAVTVAIYNLIASGITPLSWGLLAFTILWQQLFALTRTTLRVALLAALTELIAARSPRPLAPPPTEVASTDEPVYELPMLG